MCKWTYLGHEQRWDKSYFQQIGLEDVLEHDAAKIGSDVKMMGEPLGHGLTQRAASEMGLIAGTAVSVSIIDAHAGTSARWAPPASPARWPTSTAASR